MTYDREDCSIRGALERVSESESSIASVEESLGALDRGSKPTKKSTKSFPTITLYIFWIMNIFTYLHILNYEFEGFITILVVSVGKAITLGA